jgi:hypothetical protein
MLRHARTFLVVLGLAALCALPTAASSAPRASLSAQQTVRAYIAAINAKDGKRICSLLHPAEAKAISYFLPALFTKVGKPVKPVPCESLAEWIGSGGGRDNSQRWRHMTPLHTGPVLKHDHGVISIDVRMVDTWDSGKDHEDRTTRFSLVRLEGRYVIVRRSSALDMAMWSQVDNFADFPPATREPRTADVKIPAATFTCSDEVWSVDDPANDARASGDRGLDILHVALAGTPDMCVTVRLAAAPLPGTAYEISFESADGNHSQTGDFLLIAADGTGLFTGTNRSVAGADFGMADATTLVMRFPDLGVSKPGSVSVVAHPMSQSEPLIHTQPPLFGGDRAEA